MRILAEVAIVLGLMLLNGVLAMSELAMMSSRRGRLEQRAAQGDRGAEAALRRARRPDRVSLDRAGRDHSGRHPGRRHQRCDVQRPSRRLPARCRDAAATADTLALAVVVAAITYLSLVVGELVPKRLALTNPEAHRQSRGRPDGSACSSGRAIGLDPAHLDERRPAAPRRRRHACIAGHRGGDQIAAGRRGAMPAS